MLGILRKMTSHSVIHLGYPLANPGTVQVVTNKGNPSHRGLTQMTSHSLKFDIEKEEDLGAFRPAINSFNPT